MAYAGEVGGSVLPHGNTRCWHPAAVANSNSFSLGRNPPSQMQKAYASGQLTQFMGRFSFWPGALVQVANCGSQARLPEVRLLSSPESHPGSNKPGEPLSWSPRPPPPPKAALAASWATSAASLP